MKKFVCLDKAGKEPQFMTEFVFMKNPDDSQIRDIVDLYMAENWWQHGNDDSGLVKKITAGSHLFIAAIENGRVIGMGRAVSDGCSDAYIQDVTVAEAYRGKGTGSRIITLIHKKLYDD